ncbi:MULTISPECIES: hypothetical protein [unclassified Streptomyces]|uniref:Uncharacterized protein n=1 Tax=Streptomyces sp. NBC_00119 TaxID=2975659 RepID=A0AAU1UAX1_9ACTN|nr:MULTISPECIES: hypothetical protein [unclassified Streptomyces]MCX4644088.1 hypothetical protein [Streptomyces sp. NBC_01446]MCX5325200.1 hypothetical protein [Streptomyces sp. NBC_00120]
MTAPPADDAPHIHTPLCGLLSHGLQQGVQPPQQRPFPETYHHLVHDPPQRRHDAQHEPQPVDNDSSLLRATRSTHHSPAPSNTPPTSRHPNPAPVRKST